MASGGGAAPPTCCPTPVEPLKSMSMDAEDRLQLVVCLSAGDTGIYAVAEMCERFHAIRAPTTHNISYARANRRVPRSADLTCQDHSSVAILSLLRSSGAGVVERVWVWGSAAGSSGVRECTSEKQPRPTP